MSGPSRRDATSAGAGRGGPVAPGGWWWGEAMVTLGTQLLWLPLLPFRLLGLGLRAAEQAATGGPRSAAQAGAAPTQPAPPVPAAAFDAGGSPSTGATIAAGWSAAAGAAEAGTGSAGGPAGQTSCACNAADRGVAARSSETQPKEGKAMSCCDQNLSGCDLKVVQYSIVSVDPYIDNDHERIVLPRHPVLTLATQDDMTDADFTAYAIALAQRRFPRQMDLYRAEYLRVCFTVLCRFTLPCVDYEREQAEALRAINRTLERKSGLPEDGRESWRRRRREAELEDEEEESRRAARHEEREKHEGEGGRTLPAGKK